MHRRHQKNLIRAIFNTFRQIFHRRTIIITSDKSIEQYAVGGRTQFVLLSLVVGAICWGSYSTGSYMASKAVMAQKDRQLVSTTMKTRLIGEEYSQLRRDLVKLSENKGELGEYAQFVLRQHSIDNDFNLSEMMEVQPASEGEISGEAHERLLTRVSYLENRVERLQEENQQIVTAIHTRTKGKIKELTNAIKLAGFNPERMQQLARRTLPKEELMTSEDLKHQGGPYIPAVLGHTASKNIDQMMLLDSIVRRMPLGLPVQGAKITSGFGRRIDPFHRRWAMHTGIDFSRGIGAPVYATNDGMVKHASWNGSYGRQIEVVHGLGLTSRYAHLSQILVKPGQRVQEGDLIGREGSTGRSTGSHLHYEVYFNGRPLNPSNFLKAGYYVQKQKN